MINILLNGLCGKMGQEVLKEASSVFQDKCKIVCGIEKDFTILIGSISTVKTFEYNSFILA